MQVVSCHNGRLYMLKQPAAGETAGVLDASASAAGVPVEAAAPFTTGLAALDALAPAGAFARGAVHEVLSDPRHGRPLAFAMLLAKSAASQGDGAVVWCDPAGTLYPPAVAAAGISLDRLYLLRPKTEAERVWALAECLRCRGVAATVAEVGDLSRVEARRLQLAAEHGGGVGVLLRHAARNANAAHYAAATRWLVAPARAKRSVQRWSVQLVHGHGGQVGRSVILESPRGADAAAGKRSENFMRAVVPLADRPVSKAGGAGVG